MEKESKDESMQESWVEVKEQQEGGTLTHTSSKQELKQLLASAASEEEEVSDSDQLYQVTFRTTEDQPHEEEVLTQVPRKLSSRYQSQIRPWGSIPIPPSSMAKSQSSFGNGICSLTLLVPVIILTHLAMFGIGYYFGRRWSSDGSSAVMKAFHV